MYYGNQLLLPEQLTLTSEALQVDHRIKLFGFSVSIKTVTVHIWESLSEPVTVLGYIHIQVSCYLEYYVATVIIGCYVSKIMPVQKTYIHMYMQLYDNYS